MVQGDFSETSRTWLEETPTIGCVAYPCYRHGHKGHDPVLVILCAHYDYWVGSHHYCRGAWLEAYQKF
jgi:hypothetical protein